MTDIFCIGGDSHCEYVDDYGDVAYLPKEIKCSDISVRDVSTSSPIADDRDEYKKEIIHFQNDKDLKMYIHKELNLREGLELIFLTMAANK